MVTLADTAFSIACVRAEEHARPPNERLFEDPYAQLFAARVGEAREATERYLALPMFRDGVRLRTRFIDDAVRAAIGGGVRQLVLLGAGFDARGLRLSDVATTKTKVFEIDDPAQLARKQTCLEEEKVPLPRELAFVPFDFAAPHFEDALLAALTACGFVENAGAVFVWEGVIGYIDDAAIEQSLRFIVRAGGPKTTLVYTAHEGAFAPETAEARMKRHGFSACTEIGLDAVWPQLLASTPPSYANVSRLGIATI